MEKSFSKPIFYLEELRTKYDGVCYMITVEFDKKEIDAINTQWNLRMYMNNPPSENSYDPKAQCSIIRKKCHFKC